MTVARLYADENFNFHVVEILRGWGHDVLTAHEAGRANQGIDDLVLLDDAIRAGRAVLTHNGWHFIPLHRTRPSHYGIITCTRDDDKLMLATRIHVAIARCDRLDGLLLRVTKASPTT